MFPPRGIPKDVDPESHRKIAYTFFAVRMVTGCLLLVFLCAMLIAVEAKEWPRSASLVVGLGIFLELSSLLRTWFRYRGNQT